MDDDQQSNDSNRCAAAGPVRMVVHDGIGRPHQVSRPLLDPVKAKYQGDQSDDQQSSFTLPSGHALRCDRKFTRGNDFDTI
jgi:hypothetical protein